MKTKGPRSDAKYKFDWYQSKLRFEAVDRENDDSITIDSKNDETATSDLAYDQYGPNKLTSLESINIQKEAWGK